MSVVRTFAVCAMVVLPLGFSTVAVRAGTICATALAEGSTATLTCPPGNVITSIDFASYGTPTGECGAFQYGTCHSPTSLGVVEMACIGRTSCSVSASNAMFGEPCLGVHKRLYIQATYELGDSIPTGSQCEGTNVALGRPAVASGASYSYGPPARAVDGDTLWPGWIADCYAPQWIEIDLGADISVACLHLLVDMVPDGQVAHFVTGRTAAGATVPLGSFVGPAVRGQWLTVPSISTSPVRYVRVTTTASPSCVAWLEIEVLAATPVGTRRSSWGSLKSLYR
jgi:hypothetical protein